MNCNYINLYLDSSQRCMASRSAKLAHLLRSTNQIDLNTSSFTDIPADAHTFGLAVRFCYGHNPNLSADTAVPLACVASFLEMTEEHSPNNLLSLTLAFISAWILPHWNESIRSLKTITQPILPHAQHLGILHACLNSISEKAVADPNLISDPRMMTIPKGSVRKKLFVVDDHPLVEDLSSLSLPLYELVVSALACSGLPPEHLAQCVYRYAKRWLDHATFMDCPPPTAVGMDIKMSVIRDRLGQREVIEMVERLMPNERGALHVRCLFQLLRSAMSLHASQKCRSGFEARIGKQLPEASVEDLRIACYGYAKETKYDVKCVIRILNHFWSNSCPELEAVSDVLEDFAAEVAADDNLRKEDFVAISKVLITVLKPTKRSHDGLYRAVDIYLDAHGFFTEKEREEICRGLDVRQLSVEVSEHAARNERLPLRVVAQVLFVGQLRFRQAIGDLREEEEEEEEDEVGVGMAMKEMDERVRELEREFERIRKEIEKCGCGGGGKRKDGRKLWKEVKDVLGCKNRSSSKKSVECNCQATGNSS